MTTRQQLISRALHQRLRDDPAVAEGRVFRARKRPIVAKECPAVNLMPIRTDPPEGAGQDAIGKVMRELLIDAAVHVSGQEPDELADVVLEAITANLDTDRSLGGLASEISADTAVWDFETADTELAVVHLAIRIKYITGELSL